MAMWPLPAWRCGPYLHGDVVPTCMGCGPYLHGDVVPTCMAMWSLAAWRCGPYLHGDVVPTRMAMWSLSKSVNRTCMAMWSVSKSVNREGCQKVAHPSERSPVRPANRPRYLSERRVNSVGPMASTVPTTHMTAKTHMTPLL